MNLERIRWGKKCPLWTKIWRKINPSWRHRKGNFTRGEIIALLGNRFELAADLFQLRFWGNILRRQIVLPSHKIKIADNDGQKADRHTNGNGASGSGMGL